VLLKQEIEMKKTLISALFVISASTFGTVHAMPMELVNNGEFELPNLGSGWSAVPQANVPGWSSSTGYLEIWSAAANYNGQPLNGSDGLFHGQSHEITYNSAVEYSIQAISLLSDGRIDFSFDTWERFANGLSYSLEGSLSGLLVSSNHSYNNTNDWEAVEHLDLSVLAGETLTMKFQSIGGGSAGAHIDQVSMMFSAVPEPSILTLFGVGLAGLGFARRRKLQA
jgi:hypothetical protein